jgi:hypothetical protein
MVPEEDQSMKEFGYKCKTPGCQTFIKTLEMPEDSPRAVHVLLELGPDPKKIFCSNCNQAHFYNYSGRVRLVRDKIIMGGG